MPLIALAPGKPVHRPPHYANAAARNLTRAMLRAEANLPPTAIHVVGDDGRVLIRWNHGQLRQDRPGSAFVYVPKTLSLSCDSGFYRGHASRADVLDYVAYLAGGVDTVARELLLRIGPFSDFFAPDEKVRLAGSLKLAGQSVDILHIQGKVIRGSLLVRRRDHLVVSVDVDSLAKSGKVLLHEHRTYDYKPLPEPSAQVFQLSPRKGIKVRKLPKQALNLGLGL